MEETIDSIVVRHTFKDVDDIRSALSEAFVFGQREMEKSFYL